MGSMKSAAMSTTHHYLKNFDSNKAVWKSVSLNKIWTNVYSISYKKYNIVTVRDKK